MKTPQKVTALCMRDEKQTQSIMATLIDIDHICFGDLASADEGDKDYWLAHNDASFCFVAYSDDALVGYIDFVSVTQSGFNTVLQGNTRDGALDQYIDHNPDRNSIYLYLISMCVLPEHRRRGIMNLLWQTAQQWFVTNGYTIAGLVATSWSKEGGIFLQKHGFSFVGYDVAGHPIFTTKYLT